MKSAIQVLFCLGYCQWMLAAAGAEEPPESLWTRRVGHDWPAFLGPDRDSRSRETGLLRTWPEDGPKIVWSRATGTGYAIGSVAHGRFYQFDKIGDQATLFCLHAETGRELWKFAYPSSYADLYGYNDGPRCSPVVDGNRVYIFGVEGMLHCLTADTGKLIWKIDTAREFGVIQNFFGAGSSPVIEGELLLAMIGGSPPADARIPSGQLDRVSPNGSAVVAFDKFIGKIRYRTGDDLASYASLQTATIAGRRWCFAFCRSGLLGFDPTQGKIDFQYPWRARILESVNASTPVVVGNEVFISETYGPGSSLLAVAPGTHEVKWTDDARRRAKALQAHWNTPVYHEGYLYGSSGRHSDNADLRCLDWKTGAVQWSEPDTSRVSLLFADGHFISLGEFGELMLFRANPEKFELVSKVRPVDRSVPAIVGEEPRSLLKYPCWSAPVLSHGLLYIRGDDRLLCLELRPEKG